MVKAPPQHSPRTPTRKAGPLDDQVTQVARAPEDPDADPLIGNELADRYRILDKLGEGGMATVYLAEHLAIQKPCAIKVLHPEETHKENIVERFLQEARAASVIDHENVVEITDFGRTDDDYVFLVMEMLHGEDLADMLAREDRIPWSRARPMLLQICSALSAAHAKGIIHRDMKPENCFRIHRRGSDDFIKVLDFGIAKITSESVVGQRALTQTGMIFGTPEYMSPEQAEGRTVDKRTDIYSLGVIMFQLLTGRVPFRGESPTTTLVKHLVEEPQAPSAVAPDAGISPTLDAVILKALKKDPAQRFQDMEALAAAIAQIDDLGTTIDQPSSLPPPAELGGGDDLEVEFGRRRSPALVAGIAVALLAAAIGAYVALGREEAPPPPEPEPTPQVAPEPAPEPEPAPPETVSIKLESNVPAQVLDPETRAPLGNTDEALPIEKGDATRQLLLVADGYEDTLVDVTPSGDETVTAKLAKKKKGKTKKSTKGSLKPAGPVDPFPAPRP